MVVPLARPSAPPPPPPLLALPMQVGGGGGAVPPWLQELCGRLAEQVLSSDPHSRENLSTENIVPKFDNAEIVTNLNLNIRKLSVPMLHELVMALQRNSSLEILNLTSSLSSTVSLTPPLDLLALGLTNHSKLRVLHLSYNRLTQLSPVFVHAISNSALEELHLDHNRIRGKHNAQALYQVLTTTATVDPDPAKSGKSNGSMLQVLQLQSNQLGNDECLLIASALRTNTSLRILGLNGNPNITNPAISALLDVLETSNGTLERLDLDATARGSSVQETLERQSLLAHAQRLCRANQFGRKFVFQAQKKQRSPLSGLGPRNAPRDRISLHLLWPTILERISGTHATPRTRDFSKDSCPNEKKNHISTSHVPLSDSTVEVAADEAYRLDVLYYFVRSKPEWCYPVPRRGCIRPHSAMHDD